MASEYENKYDRNSTRRGIATFVCCVCIPFEPMFLVPGLLFFSTALFSYGSGETMSVLRKRSSKHLFHLETLRKLQVPEETLENEEKECNRDLTALAEGAVKGTSIGGISIITLSSIGLIFIDPSLIGLTAIIFSAFGHPYGANSAAGTMKWEVERIRKKSI